MLPLQKMEQHQSPGGDPCKPLTCKEMGRSDLDFPFWVPSEPQKLGAARRHINEPRRPPEKETPSPSSF